MQTDVAKALVREYFHRLLNEKDLSVCDELLSAEYVDHDAPADTPRGPSSTKAFVARFIQDYPDPQIRVEDILAEGDRVAARLTWQGTHRETGARLHQMGLVIVRLNDAGQLAERWSAYAAMP
ncbi:MAG: ester cyclase [Anaerolineae bacterium]|nr:ester cyclase [Anaerolineae bacterium]